MAKTAVSQQTYLFGSRFTETKSQVALVGSVFFLKTMSSVMYEFQMG